MLYKNESTRPEIELLISPITLKSFFRNTMWNSLMTLKYQHGHRQSHHVKAVVWPYVKNDQNTVNNRNKNRHFQRPHSHLTTPLQQTPANIFRNLILPETAFLGEKFGCCKYMRSSASFHTIFTENHNKRNHYMLNQTQILTQNSHSWSCISMSLKPPKRLYSTV